MGSDTAIDLSKLPPPAVIEDLSFDAIVAARKSDLQSRVDALGDAALSASVALALASPAELLTKDIEQAAYRELIQRARVNDAARGNMLATARGRDLDNLGANLEVQRLDGEEDETYRARIASAPDGWSVAGPEGAYKFHARSASPLVADVQVISPAPGQVLIYVLSTAPTGAPDAPTLAAVQAACSAADVRPLTDHVVVVAATIAAYDITATLHIAGGLDSEAVALAAEAAVRAYAASRRRIGRGVAERLVAGALAAPGVENIDRPPGAGDIPAVVGVAPVLGSVTLTLVVGGAGV